MQNNKKCNKVKGMINAKLHHPIASKFRDSTILTTPIESYGQRKRIYQSNFRNIVLSFHTIFLLLLCSCSTDKEVKQVRSNTVEVGQVIQKNAPLYVYAVGNADAYLTIDVRSQVTGVLKKAHVIEGQMIDVDQLIYTIDPEPYQAQLEQAQAQLREDEASLKLAEERVTRYKSLAEKEYISELQFDELVTNVALAQAKVDLDKAQIEEAEINLEYCYISSPIPGKISYNVLDPGNLITANSPSALTTVRQMDPIQIEFSISQRDFLKWQNQNIELNSPFDFIFLNMDGEEVIRRGAVFFIDNNINLSSGTVLIKGLVDNQDLSIWPGAFGKVRLIIKTVKDAVLMPAAALQTGEKNSYVYIVEEGNIVQSKDITVIESYEDYLMVGQGLNPGDIVVTNGQINLRPGIKVQIKENQKETSNHSDSKEDSHGGLMSSIEFDSTVDLSAMSSPENIGLNPVLESRSVCLE